MAGTDRDCTRRGGVLEGGTIPNATLSPSESSEFQELCERRGGRPGLFVLMSLAVSVDVKQH